MSNKQPIIDPEFLGCGCFVLCLAIALLVVKATPAIIHILEGIKP